MKDSKLPKAKCAKCWGYTVKKHVYISFSYCYCSKCKVELKEGEVLYEANPNPRGLIPPWIYGGHAIGGVAPIELLKSGLYRLVYTDGTEDFYQKEFGGLTIFDGAIVKSATRIS